MLKIGLLNYKKTFLSLLIVSAIFLLWPNYEVQANASHNIRGWAYNSSYGYISMNCLDDSFAGRFTFTFPFVFFITPCSISQHGVNLDDNNNFSGQAWNSILGFISFEGVGAPDYDYEVSCPTNCDAGNSCTACYNETTGGVYGWAKIVSSGIWIKLDDTSVPPATRISDYNAANPGIFSGYASSTISGLGQVISFNCNNDGSCGTNPYEVRIGPLEIRQLTAPNWSSEQVCQYNETYKAVLAWNRRSGQQSAYRVIVSTANSTSTGVVADVTASSSVNQYIINGLTRNTAYYWFLQLWDASGLPTAWRQFDTNKSGLIKDVLTDNSARNTAIGNSKTFTSYKHKFPVPYFTFPSSDVEIGTSTPFNGDSSLYNNDGDTLQPCNGSICNYSWSVTGDDRAVIDFPNMASTTIVFARATSTTVRLQVTDDVLYTCSTSTILNANYALPIWKEIKPTN